MFPHGTAVAPAPEEGVTMYYGRMQGELGPPAGNADTRLTYDDLLLLPDDGMRHEIIDGEHYVTPSPIPRHQVLLGRLYFEIEYHIRRHPGIGRVFLSPLDVVFTKWDVVEPDLLFIASSQTDIIGDKNIQGPPALVVEILSPGTRNTDEQIKLRLFERGGVGKYWIVDPERNVVKVFSRQADGSFPSTVESREQSDTLTTPLIPGLAISLSELFAS
jgi:Uma2 family endonuclease